MESKDCAEVDDDVVCCICLEAIKVRDGRVLLISLGCCGKLHHLKCITEMLRRMQGVKKCPACNIKIAHSELSQLVPGNLNISERFLQVNNRPTGTGILEDMLLNLDRDIETENRSINEGFLQVNNRPTGILENLLLNRDIETEINERLLRVNNRHTGLLENMLLNSDIETENRSINDETMMYHNSFISEEIEDIYEPLWESIEVPTMVVISDLIIEDDLSIMSPSDYIESPEESKEEEEEEQEPERSDNSAGDNTNESDLEHNDGTITIPPCFEGCTEIGRKRNRPDNSNNYDSDESHE